MAAPAPTSSRVRVYDALTGQFDVGGAAAQSLVLAAVPGGVRWRSTSGSSAEGGGRAVNRLAVEETTAWRAALGRDRVLLVVTVFPFYYMVVLSFVPIQ